MSQSAFLLLFHGALLMLVGNLCGIPFGRAIATRRGEDEIRAWRVAHSGNVSGGAAMIAVAAGLSAAEVAGLQGWIVAAPLILSAYGFGIALPIGAAIGARGIVFKGGGAAKAIFLGNAIGAIGSLIGSFALIAVLLAKMIRS